MNSEMRAAKLLLLTALILLGVTVGCFSNTPPSTPVLFGPDTTRAGDTVRLGVWSSDPDEDYIAFEIIWGDTTRTELTPLFSMIDTIFRTHVYAAAGRYGITARAQDINGRKSGWSDTLHITVLP